MPTNTSKIFFTKTVVVSGSEYTINVFTDISKAISVDSVISFSIHNNEGMSILTPDKINTNNDLSVNHYIKPNYPVAITLSKKVYDAGFKRYDHISIPQDISIVDDIYFANDGGLTDRLYFQSNVLVDGVVTISIIQHDENDLSRPTFHAPLEPTTTYTISIDFNILLGITDSEICELNFITDDGIFNNVLLKQFTTECNNAVFKLNNMDSMDDIRRCFSNSNPLDYQFVPVVKNSNGVMENAVDAVGNDIVLQFDVTKTLQDLYIKQYLSEYVEYFNTLDIITSTNTYESAEQESEVINRLNETKISMLTHSNLINSFTKGTLSGMNTILALFCQNIGQYSTYHIEVSPENSNFIYRVTTDMPKMYWTNIIKDIIHPVSWRDEYIQIDNGKSNLPTTSALYPSAIQHNAYGINNRDRTKRMYGMIRSLNNPPTSWLDITNNAPYFGDTCYYEEAAMENLDTPYKYQFYPNEYGTIVDGSIAALQLDYDNQELKNELDAVENIVVYSDLDSDHDVMVMNVEYKFTGVALEYEYEVSYSNNSNNDIQTLRSYSPRYRCQLPSDVTTATVKITLINGDFSHQLTKVVTF